MGLPGKPLQSRMIHPSLRQIQVPSRLMFSNCFTAMGRENCFLVLGGRARSWPCAHSATISKPNDLGRVVLWDQFCQTLRFPLLPTPPTCWPGRVPRAMSLIVRGLDQSVTIRVIFFLVASQQEPSHPCPVATRPWRNLQNQAPSAVLEVWQSGHRRLGSSFGLWSSSHGKMCTRLWGELDFT